MQRGFVEAVERAQADQERERRLLEVLLAAFRDPASMWIPASFASVMAHCSEALSALGINSTDWRTIDSTITVLEGRRSPQTRARIDALNKAIASLRRPLSADMRALAEALNASHDQLRALRSTSDEVAQSGVIREALAFFTSRQGITTCPVCERPLEAGYAETFERLKQRGTALEHVRDLETRRGHVLDQLITDAQRAADQLASDLEHSPLFDPGELHALRAARAGALRWSRRLRQMSRDGSLDAIEVPLRLQEVTGKRSSAVDRAEMQRKSLIPQNEVQLENTIALLRRAKTGEAAIRQAEVAVQEATRLVSDAQAVRLAFTQAREQAIQKAFDQIAQQVLCFYRKLHDHGGQALSSECSELALTQTARAAAGGLRLLVKFLGLTDFRDPRPFLSEGHLDSLGLCLFLGTVRIFNRPGSLLVLDDVLTSIDMGHRYRVAQLLFEEFRNYQLVITTHDEHWFQILQSSARARGEQGDWRFSRIVRWTVEHGPESAAFEGTWDYINQNLTEQSYRELGGPLRVVLEDFLKRVAVKLELKVRYNIDGRHTSGDFLQAGIDSEIRNRLIASNPTEEPEIKQDVARVFGMGDLINFLSHDNPGRLEVTFEQASDFVVGLKSLAARCEMAKLIKGVTT